MDNIFAKSAAPYVLAILVSVLGWLINSTISELKDLRLVEYQVTYQKQSGVSTATVILSNKSPSHPIVYGSFGFECRIPDTPAEPCFADLIPNRKAEFVRVGNVTIASSPTQITPQHFQVDALIPPRSSIGYKFGLANSEATILPTFDLANTDLNDASNIRVSLSEGNTLEGFIMTNYLRILLWTAFVFCLPFLVWLFVSFFCFVWERFRSVPVTVKYPEAIKIKGAAYEITIPVK